MTMLDRMRRHKSWLKWSLGIVVATFIALYVPSFLRGGGVGAAPSDAIATVNGLDIPVSTYQRVYQQQVDQLRQAYGNNFNDQTLKQLGISQRIIQQLVDEEAVLAEAKRLGLSASDAELRERIVRDPRFQQNGQFVGYDTYVQMLMNAQPPILQSDFEDSLRDEIITEKLQSAVTGWVRVDDADVDAEYRKRNEKAKIDLAVFTSNQFRTGIVPTDAELQAQFTAHTDAYKIPEKRRVKFLAIDAQALKGKMAVTDQQIEQRYKDNLQTYSTPEQIRASHILFKTEGKDDAAVKKVAESVLAKVKAGGDFAALAKQYSEDGSAKDGGDLNYFGRGAMVKEFDDAAWKLNVGQVSDLVKSQFGYHIIKLTDKKPAATKTLAEVRPQIEDQIKTEEAQAEASKLAADLGKEIKAPGDLDKVAKAHGLTVGDSGLFSRDEPMVGLGFAPAVADQAFSMQQNAVSGMLQTTQGFAYITLAEVKPAYAPKLDEVKDKVRDDVVKAKAVDVARAKADAMAQALAKGTSFDAAAKAAGVAVKSTDFVARGAAYPEVGVSPTIDAAVFDLKAGQTSAPIATNDAVVIARLKELQAPNAATATADHDAIRTELTDQHREEFFSAYMTKAKAKMKINFNEEAIKAVLGS
jgi:peptidyl-prolyl cis-trans isomerase D